eukprot:3266378-Amphidinium_carterae.3
MLMIRFNRRPQECFREVSLAFLWWSVLGLPVSWNKNTGMATETKLLLLVTTLCIILTTYHSCFRLKVGTNTSIRSRYYMEIDEAMLELTPDTFANIRQTQGDDENDLAQL